MKSIRKHFKSLLEEIFVNTTNRLCVQLRLFCIAGCVIAVIMTILNYAKGEYVLGLETGIGAAVIVIIYLYVSKTRHYLAGSTSVALIFLGQFTVFLVSGSVEGFAALWFCLYPFICLFVFDIKLAVLFSIIGFLTLSSFLWTPLQHILPPVYTRNFLLRFPFLYIGNFTFALALNGFYSYTYNRLLQMNRIFERLSNQDGLTKLANRTYLEQYKKELFQKGENRISAVMLDVDYFKQYNDTYGHLAGDEVLKTIAQLIIELLPPGNSIAVRYGGEEFLVLLPEYDQKAAMKFAQQLLDKIHKQQIPHAAGKGNVSVSIGVCCRKIATETDFLDLLHQADNAMYSVKQNGRDGIAADV